MQRFLITILSVFYLSIATGTSYQFHYCMGELAQWNFGHSKNEDCPRCGMEKSETDKSGCCKDEYKFVKLTVDQKQESSSFSNLSFLSLICPAPQNIEILPFEQKPGPQTLVLLRSKSIPVYIFHCNYRI